VFISDKPNDEQSNDGNPGTTGGPGGATETTTGEKVTLGTSIFLSVVLVSVVALYIATKDRWNWKKIILWPFLGITALLVLAGIAYYISYTIGQRPRLQNTFWEITLDSTKEDVKFKKGEPTKIKEKGSYWVYEISNGNEESTYNLAFMGDDIWWIGYFGGSLWTSSIQGLGVRSSYESVIRKFGKPSYESRSEDDLQRILSFDEYNVFFYLIENEVVVYGIYNPRFGPIV